MSELSERAEHRISELSTTRDGGNERDALRVVLDIHAPDLWTQDEYMCARCTGVDVVFYPCPTVLAIAREMGVSFPDA